MLLTWVITRAGHHSLTHLFTDHMTSFSDVTLIGKRPENSHLHDQAMLTPAPFLQMKAWSQPLVVMNNNNNHDNNAFQLMMS